jgi:predicted nucleic acid-binding protein
VTAQGVAYLDSSALVKLVIEETETAALNGSLADWPRRMTSCIAEVEVLRAVRRIRDTAAAVANAREVLQRLVLIDLDADVRSTAAAIAPSALRSFDGVHLASALGLGEELVAFATYDRRLFAAALAAGLPAVAPGQQPA